MTNKQEPTSIDRCAGTPNMSVAEIQIAKQFAPVIAKIQPLREWDVCNERNAARFVSFQEKISEVDTEEDIKRWVDFCRARLVIRIVSQQDRSEIIDLFDSARMSIAHRLPLAALRAKLEHPQPDRFSRIEHFANAIIDTMNRKRRQSK